jgi:hypothetical protein
MQVFVHVGVTREQEGHDVSFRRSSTVTPPSLLRVENVFNADVAFNAEIFIRSGFSLPTKYAFHGTTSIFWFFVGEHGGLLVALEVLNKLFPYAR